MLTQAICIQMFCFIFPYCKANFHGYAVNDCQIYKNEYAR